MVAVRLLIENIWFLMLFILMISFIYSFLWFSYQELWKVRFNARNLYGCTKRINLSVKTDWLPIIQSKSSIVLPHRLYIISAICETSGVESGEKLNVPRVCVICIFPFFGVYVIKPLFEQFRSFLSFKFRYD